MTLERILYAEDEPDIRTVGKLALEAVGGFTIQVCEHGGEVCEAARSFAPDLILLDVMMPTMDGPAALAALRADPELAKIPVIFMTAKVQRSEIERYIELGALDVIPKPFDPMTLHTAIRASWESKRSAA